MKVFGDKYLQLVFFRNKLYHILVTILEVKMEKNFKAKDVVGEEDACPIAE